MAQKPLSDAALRQTLAFYDAAHGITTEAAKLAGVPRETFQARLAKARTKFGLTTPTAAVDHSVKVRVAEKSELEHLRKENAALRQAVAAKGAAPKIPRPVKRQGKDDLVRVVIPDSHGSHVDTQVFAAVEADVLALDPDEIVGLGDHLDCGGFLAAHHIQHYVAQLDECSWEDDLAAWGDQLNRLMKAAPRARWTLLEGNHEQRIERWAVGETLGNRKDADGLMRAMAPQFRLDYAGRGIDYVRYGELREGVPVRGAVRLGKCYFTHGFATGPSAALKHAQKFGAPVVYGHTHTPASYFGKSVHGGVHAAWCPGHISKNAPRYGHNSPDNWGHGYLLQIVARSGLFTTVHVPIVRGVSLLPMAFRRAAE